MTLAEDLRLATAWLQAKSSDGVSAPSSVQATLGPALSAETPHGSAARLLAFSPSEEDCRVWPLRNGVPSQWTEVQMLLATHGWWPWLLMFAVIIAAVGYGIYYFMKRRRGA